MPALTAGESTNRGEIRGAPQTIVAGTAVAEETVIEVVNNGCH